jgi:peptidoglycan/xylan/chitin deacetylase (PgdA/CDA1 family)
MGTEPARGALFDGDCTLSWEEIGQMDRAGVAFGSHTHTHQILTKLAAGAVRRELRESKAALDRALGKRCDLFAYPNGEWSEETRRILAEEGFRLAFTTERGVWTEDCDPLRIPRPNICERNLAGLLGGFSPAMFEYTTFWKTWRAVKAGGAAFLAPRRLSTGAERAA